MADQDNPRKRHFILEGATGTEPFQSRSGRGSSVPNRDQKRHGSKLLGQIEALRSQQMESDESPEVIEAREGFEIRVEFESFPDIDLALESLARERAGIELLNVRQEERRMLATVFVPDGKLVEFEKLVQAYLDESQNTRNGPRNRRLLNTISDIRAATLDALWTDERGVFPLPDDMIWWEVWLRVRDDRTTVTEEFKRAAQELDFEFAPGEIYFPERTVVLMYGSANRMKESALILNSIAELRRSKETAEFFDSLSPEEQADWANDLLGRLTMVDDGLKVPYICLFDTGVNNGHPLIATALTPADLHTVEPGWGIDDGHGHGTEMAGLALMGNLTDALDSQDLIDVTHRLESVKILPKDHVNGSDARHHGWLTIEAVGRPEITAPYRHRLFSMAVTARDNRDRGRPSAWSGAIDRLAADVDGNGETRRLFILSAGNVNDPNAWTTYPASNETDSVHDPGQSWNALTVGAATHLVQITEPDTANYRPVAPTGGISPFSTTSATWQTQWPLKPDVVFEGGNAAKDDLGAVWTASLSLLTTDSEPTIRLFTTANATSAASALAARMAAQLMAEYPEFWPETIRALIPHSAEWTDAMQQMFLPGNPRRGDFIRLVRWCGFGIPDLERAMWSVENSLTMVCQASLRPFRRVGSASPILGDMNLHRLPWPLQALEALGETPVEMRVTLSYFIEPNPSARGFSGRYSYGSHGLRFDVKRSTESLVDFRKRINVAARDDLWQKQSSAGDSGWVIGTQNRHRGSLHSDIWRGSAVDLARRGVIGVYPTAGWWKTRHKLGRYDADARYALVVSIRTPDIDVELYSAVANQIGVSVAT